MSKYLYFGPEIDDAITVYNETDDQQIKNEIFEKKIKSAFQKLIESQLFMYRFYKLESDIETLKSEALYNLYTILPKFNSKAGKKAFSYFNVVLYNFFIFKIRERNKKTKQFSENVYGIDSDVIKNDPSLVLSSHEDKIIEKEFLFSLFKDVENWRRLCKKKQHLQILDAIVFLLKNPGLVSIYNKKAVILYIKEMTGLNSKQVNSNIIQIKQMYDDFKERFYNE